MSESQRHLTFSSRKPPIPVVTDLSWLKVFRLKLGSEHRTAEGQQPTVTQWSSPVHRVERDDREGRTPPMSALVCLRTPPIPFVSTPAFLVQLQMHSTHIHNGSMKLKMQISRRIFCLFSGRPSCLQHFFAAQVHNRNYDCSQHHWLQRLL